MRKPALIFALAGTAVVGALIALISEQQRKIEFLSSQIPSPTPSVAVQEKAPAPKGPQLFADPLLRISKVSDRIRETERFIEEGFLREDFLTLGNLLSSDWQQEEAGVGTIQPFRDAAEARRKAAELEQRQAEWKEKHGSIREGVARWIEFLKKCESRIDAIPAAFAGLGNDSLLAQFLKDERTFKLVYSPEASAEMLPQLARIGADHWLARFEDLRYHLEWFLRYSKLPSETELDLSNLSNSERQRPDIRLRFAITGNRETDLQQYRKTLLNWASRDDVFEDSSARLSYGGKPRSKSAPPVTDALRSEKLHGEFLGKVSRLWQRLAIAAADRGDIDEAIRMLRRDLEGRSVSDYSGGILACYLVCAGKFDEAWQAYREHLLNDPPFDAFELRQRCVGLTRESHFLSDTVEGIDLSTEFEQFPQVLSRIKEWNETVTVVDGRHFAELGSVVDTLLSHWFKNLDDFSKLRVLYYYNSTRPHEKDIEYYERTGEVRDLRKSVNEREEFEAWLHMSDEAKSIWARATADRGVDFPL